MTSGNGTNCGQTPNRAVREGADPHGDALEDADGESADGKGDVAGDGRAEEDGVNEELQKQLAEMLKALTSVAGDAAGWANGQIPSLVQEKIAFGRVWETGAFIGFLVASVVVAYGVRVAWKVIDDEELLIPISIMGAIASATSFFLGISYAENVVLVWVAPRLYIVQWVKGMVQ